MAPSVVRIVATYLFPVSIVISGVCEYCLIVVTPFAVGVGSGEVSELAEAVGNEVVGDEVVGNEVVGDEVVGNEVGSESLHAASASNSIKMGRARITRILCHISLPGG